MLDDAERFDRRRANSLRRGVGGHESGMLRLQAPQLFHQEIVLGVGDLGVVEHVVAIVVVIELLPQLLANEPYVITPPWSSIVAYDLNTGKIKWRTPYGDLPEAGPSDKLRGNVYPKSGPVITAGGLVLFAGNDSKLYALDKDTGKLIGTKDLPNGSLGVPAVYEVNGKQYVLLTVAGGNPCPAGGRMGPGGTHSPQVSKSYIAFALP